MSAANQDQEEQTVDRYQPQVLSDLVLERKESPNANISVFGAGYVGLVTGACFADLGHTVTCIDVNRDRVNQLQAGQMPVFEPGLEEIVRRNVAAGRLHFASSFEGVAAHTDFAFIAVGTPSGLEGEADLSYVRAAARTVAENMDHDTIVVNKSTVPIGTGDWVADIIERHRRPDVPFAVVSNPEFLREGSAVSDFMNPDRIVLGSANRAAAEAVARLYLSLRAPILITDLRTAEMIKYASNAFLATRISFINEIASICEALGADVKQVAVGMGYDRRIGKHFLDAGVGYGGSCFPKDVKALEHMAAVHGQHPQLLRAVMEINRDKRRQVVQKLRDVLGALQDKQIGVLGLAFKPNTDDIRESPAIEIIHLLESEGAVVKAYDPVAMDNARKVLPNCIFSGSAYEAAEDADGLIVVTEWNEFKNLDLIAVRDSMRRPVLIDGRNIYDTCDMVGLGFIYRGVGRSVLCGNGNGSGRCGHSSGDSRSC